MNELDIILAIDLIVLAYAIGVFFYGKLSWKRLISKLMNEIMTQENEYILKSLQNLREQPETQALFMNSLKPTLDKLVDHYMHNLNPMKSVKTDDMIKMGIFQIFQNKFMPQTQQPKEQPKDELDFLK